MLKKFSLFSIFIIIFITSLNALEVRINEIRHLNQKIIRLTFDTTDHLGKKKDNWIAIYKPGTSNEWKNVITWAWLKDLSNSIAPPDSLKNRYYFHTLPKGNYELRLFRNNSFETFASFSFHVTGQPVEAKLEIAHQTESNISFNSTAIKNTWIGIFKKADSKNEWRYVKAWAWVKEGQASIDLTDLPRGNYRADLFYKNSFHSEKSIKFSHNGLGQEPFIKVEKKFIQINKIDFSSSFQVGKFQSWVGLYEKDAVSGIRNRLGFARVTSSSSSMSIAKTEKGVVYELRLFYDGIDEPVARTELTLNERPIFMRSQANYSGVYEIQETLTRFAPKNRKDWIGIFKKTAERKRENIISYVSPFLNGNTTNKIVLTIPHEKAEYDLVYFLNDSYESLGKPMELHIHQ